MIYYYFEGDAFVSSVPAGVETKAKDLTMAVKSPSAVLTMALLLFWAWVTLEPVRFLLDGAKVIEAKENM
jgi:hypothetical protein